MTATTRGYPLPHPENIASEDAMRIRQSLQMTSGDIDEIHALRAKDKLETTINLWS